jgi:hypothetical protein
MRRVYEPHLLNSESDRFLPMSQITTSHQWAIIMTELFVRLVRKASHGKDVV